MQISTQRQVHRRSPTNNARTVGNIKELKTILDLAGFARLSLSHYELLLSELYSQSTKVKFCPLIRTYGSSLDIGGTI